MKYTQGQVGRVLVARFEHGDDLLQELHNLAELEQLEAAVIYLIGAIKQATMVVGPEECARPPVPVWRKFEDCREILCIGTLFREDGKPALHLHAATGKGDFTLTGCIRRDTEVYLVVEAVILELTGLGAARTFDPACGLKVLDFLTSD